MPITIKGIRIQDIHLNRDESSNALKLHSSTYALMSSADKVLANQSIGGYNGVAVNPSPQTLKLLDEFTASYKQDVTATLGLEEA